MRRQTVAIPAALACVSVLSAVGWAAPNAHSIVEVHTAAPNVIVVVLEYGPAPVPEEPEPPPALPAPSLAGWTVNGVTPRHVYRYSLPYDEQKKVGPSFDVTVRHRIYLVLANSLASGSSYAIHTPYGDRTFAFDENTASCESIKVNMAGYSGRATSRFANFGVYMGDGGSMTVDPPPGYTVVADASGAQIASGRAVYMGDDTTQSTWPQSGVYSGEHVYRLSLNAVPAGGPYHLRVSGCGRSPSFGVGDDYSREIAKVVTRALYHQRCGIELTQPYTKYSRGACVAMHTQVDDARQSAWHNDVVPLVFTPTGRRIDVVGGYHDAGDYDRRPMHTVIPLLMLGYFEAFPTHFLDGQYDIPESGNGIPDFLDEALWGLKLWEALQITDPSEGALYGAVRAGTGDWHPTYGQHTAATDDSYPLATTYRVEDSAEAGDDMPLGGDVTALCAGMFAQAARLLRPYAATDPDVRARADQLQARAVLAWNSLVARGLPVHAAQTRYMYAALQLYLATGLNGPDLDHRYHDIFEAAAQQIVLTEGSWPEQYLPGNISARCLTAHFASYALASSFRADGIMDAGLVRSLRDRIVESAQSRLFMGPPPETQAYPQGVTKYLGWGSATAQGRYADVFAFASLFAADPQPYVNAVSQYADHSLGLNPMGISYFTGLKEHFADLGDRRYAGLVANQVLSPLHDDSYDTKYGTGEHAGRPIGNVPGILVYGPAGRSGAGYEEVISNQIYPYFSDDTSVSPRVPPERQWGDGWSLVHGNEFSTWETIVWAAVMHGFLYDAGGPMLLSIGDATVTEGSHASLTAPRPASSASRSRGARRR